MNLDDFLVTDNMPTPHAHESGMKQTEERPSHSASSAIPINKSRKDSAQQQTFVPQSVPVPAHRQRLQDEFGYVARHVRKTSIDEARVGDPIGGQSLSHV
jgi:GATA-binding protein